MDITYKVINRNGAWFGVEIDSDTGKEGDLLSNRHRNTAPGKRAAERDCLRRFSAWRAQGFDLNVTRA